MPKADPDPLWYDRVEPGEAPGTLLRITGLVFAGSCAILERSGAMVAGALDRSRTAIRRIRAGWSYRGLLRLFD